MKKQEEFLNRGSVDERARKKNSFHIGTNELSWQEEGEKVRYYQFYLYLYNLVHKRTTTFRAD